MTLKSLKALDCLFRFLSAKAGVAVKDLNAKLFGTKHDVLALAGRYVVSNLSSVFFVVHEEEFKFAHVVHYEFVEY